MEEHTSEAQPAASAERTALLARLASGLAHEIKNPLSTMAINLSLLEEEFSGGRAGDAPQPSPKDRRCEKRVRTLQREVTRLEGILEDFLRFARGGEVNRSPQDIVALVGEVLEFIEPEHKAAGIRVHTDLSPSLPMVLLDPGAFKQALMNLMVNARQAMPGDGELIVQVQRVGTFVELTVTDTGVGMDEDQREHCFDLYWSTRSGGTGLGLPTVARIVDEHEGTLSVLSELGRGTSFTLRFPLVQEVTGGRS